MRFPALDHTRYTFWFSSANKELSFRAAGVPLSAIVSLLVYLSFLFKQFSTNEQQ